MNPLRIVYVAAEQDRRDQLLVLRPVLLDLAAEQLAEHAGTLGVADQGPAQALSNAIFQVEYIERVIDSDPAGRDGADAPARAAPSRARHGPDVHQPAPPPASTGRASTARSRMPSTGSTALTGLAIATELGRRRRLDDRHKRSVLRVAQEALQNVRKHAAASTVVVGPASTDEAGLEVRDDGRGFDLGAVAARGRRNFGMQFMHERAELIGARFEYDRDRTAAPWSGSRSRGARREQRRADEASNRGTGAAAGRTRSAGRRRDRRGS